MELHFQVHKNLPLVQNFHQIKPIHSNSFNKIHFNIILPYNAKFPSGLYPSGYLIKIFIFVLSCKICIGCP
jgi:hypothetical protein